MPSTVYNTTPFSSGPDMTDNSSSSYSTSFTTSYSFNGSEHRLTSENGYRTSPENLTNEMVQHCMSVNNLITAQTKCCTNKVLHAQSYAESESSLNGNDSLKHESAGNSRGTNVILPDNDNEKGCNITSPSTGIGQPIVPLPRNLDDITYQDQPTEQKYCSCQICGKHFASAWTLREHNRVHTGESSLKLFTLI